MEFGTTEISLEHTADQLRSDQISRSNRDAYCRFTSRKVETSGVTAIYSEQNSWNDLHFVLCGVHDWGVTVTKFCVG